VQSYDPNDPALRTWAPVPDGSDFPIQNLPFGIFQAPGLDARPAVAIGSQLLDLAEAGLLEGDSLDPLLARGKNGWREMRSRISWLLNDENPELRDDAGRVRRCLHAQRDVEMKLPVRIGDYVDFYSSLEHATNVGRMFRDPNNPLLPNWRWMPIGYHGRAGTVAVSGTPVRRPKGQLSADNQTAVFAPSRRLDIELEMGFLVGANVEAGTMPGPDAARDAIFGAVLLNDWSARDIQRWEYQPLGPFLGKSFLTSISPWVVTMDALEPFRTNGPDQNPPPLEYLHEREPRNFDIQLEVWLRCAGATAPQCIARTNFRQMYWSAAQQLAHMTSNGASARRGDLFGSGTISGTEPDSCGSLLELAWNGTRPLKLDCGAERSFLTDGDSIRLRGWCDGPYRIGFGDVEGVVTPA
jgi:fumarylacetoacetase